MQLQNRKVVIIGAGHVGSHAGFTLIAQGLVDEIVYIDVDEKKAQAQALEAKGVRIDHVVSIEVDDHDIANRMGGRRVCSKCGASYHVVNIPPKKEGICDVCGGALKQRKDDDPATVKDRLAVYHKETEPLKGFYEARGVLKTVEDQPTVEGTTREILRVLGVAE